MMFDPWSCSIYYVKQSQLKLMSKISLDHKRLLIQMLSLLRILNRYVHYTPVILINLQPTGSLKNLHVQNIQ